MRVDILRHPSAPEHVLEVFDALREGEDLLLITDQKPRDVLIQLQERRKDAFEWWPLLEGPDRWRTWIRKRAPEPRGVTDLIRAEHRRLNEMARDIIELALSGAVEEAAGAFQEYRHALRRHARIEEEMLFPAFDLRTGLSNGPTDLLKDDHGRIDTAVGRLARALSSGSAWKIHVAVRALREALSVHEMKEESILYPLLDQTLSEPVREDLIRLIQWGAAKSG